MGYFFPESKDISIVVQGPTKTKTISPSEVKRNITQARHHFPNAEIILSTWEGQIVDQECIDKIIYNTDPGPCIDSRGKENNTNRLILSTKNGLMAATRRFSLKTRTDISIAAPDICVISDKPSQLFDHPVTITNLYTRDPNKIPFLFHPSDIIQFGLTSDLLNFWDSPLFKYTDLYSDAKGSQIFGNYMGYTNLSKVPEQALTISWLHRHGFAVHFPQPNFVTPRLIIQSEDVLINNFHLLDYKRSGVIFPARFLKSNAIKHIYSVSTFEKLYVAQRNIFYRYSRAAQIITKKYLMAFFIPSWWISFVAIISFSISPTLGKYLRRMWQKMHGTGR